MDLDSDNDGVPDNIESQLTASYIIPQRTNLAKYRLNDGLNLAYLNGLTPIDSEGDGTPDYLDLDTDNDGDFDIDEAGIRTLDNDLNNDGRTDNPVGINGLENFNGIESSDDYSDVNGLAHDNTSFY